MNGSKLFGDKLPGFDGRQVGYATLNPSNSQLRRQISNVFRYWAAPNGDRQKGVDGFRIDHMMDDLDLQHVKTGMLTNFWLPIERSIRQIKPNAFFLAEQADWSSGTEIFEKAKVDAVYAIPLRMAWMTFDKAKIEKAISAMAAVTPKGKTQIVFIENHDVERYASAVNRDPDLLRLGAVFSVTLKGTPLVYYGQELGMSGIQGNWKTDANDIPVRLAYRWTRKTDGPGSADFYRGTGPWASDTFVKNGDGVSVEEQIHNPSSLLEFYRRLIRLRSSNPALQRGTQTIVDSPAGLVVYDRREGIERLRVILNVSNSIKPIQLEAADLPGRDLWSGKALNGPNVAIPPHGFKILRLTK
jgi:glycosidase